VAFTSANDRDDDDLEELEDERADLKTALVQAKNKPRHFAIIAKGPEVLALFAQKKPLRPGNLRQARRDKGGKQIIQGTCQGDGGTKLVFKNDVFGPIPAEMRDGMGDGWKLDSLKKRLER